MKKKLSRFIRGVGGKLGVPIDLVRRRYPEQIHAETYYKDEVWERIIKSDYGDSVWYVMTPANYEYFRNLMGVSETKKELSKVMKKRLKKLDELYELGLHIHFYFYEEMPTEKKTILFSEALDWIDSAGVRVEKFVPGWFNYDPDLYGLCEKFDLKLVEPAACIHDWEIGDNEVRRGYEGARDG